MDTRDARTVIESHLALRQKGDVERDIEENFAPDVVLLTGTEVYHGHDGVRRSSNELMHNLGEGTFEYDKVPVEGRMGFLEWAAKGTKGNVRDGADSFLVEDGLIRCQTIHYTVEK